MKAKKLIRYLLDADYRFAVNDSHGLYRKMSDESYLKKKYYAKFGKKLNLSNPQTFSEKIQWLKLHDRKPIYSRMVDKIEAKLIVAELIGNEYIIPTLGIWDRFEDINFDELPDQFVLKCSHDSGGLVICKDKNKFDVKKAEEKIRKSLQHNYYLSGREWPYKNVNPRIMAEQYVEDSSTEELRDYKFFCFDGKVKALFVASDRQKEEETKFDFFDENYNHLPFENGHPNANVIPEKPATFEAMKKIAEKLSAGIPHLRVDLYEVDGRIYFGEMTFCHWSGFQPFSPEEWDYTFGSWIKLPTDKN